MRRMKAATQSSSNTRELPVGSTKGLLGVSTLDDCRCTLPIRAQQTI
jgi:hypothetical protein